VWLANPDEEEPLSQGDLVSELYFPQLSLPQHVIPAPGNPALNATVLTVVPKPAAIVVTQCCQLDKPGNKHVVLAPVKSTKLGSDAERTALMAEKPRAWNQPGDNPGYVYNSLYLEQFGEVIPERADLVWVADLNQSTAFSGDLSELRKVRVAKMTPGARRLLRIKLAYFWGRATDEDRAALAALGLADGTLEDRA
jgi:hypothetical protein